MGRESRHIPVNLGYKLKKIRTGMRLSQGKMLTRLKTHLENPDNGILKRLEIFDSGNLYRSSISGYELGLRMPPYYVIMAYAEIANIYLDVLFDDTIKLSPFDKLPYKKKDSGIQSFFIEKQFETDVSFEHEDDDEA